MKTEEKLKIAIQALKAELELKMMGQGKFYDKNVCVLYKALKELGEVE